MVFSSWIGWCRARSLAWSADAVRLFFGLIYWNVKKSIFRLRGSGGRNPCQNLADGDAPGEIRCDACLSWNQPARFRRVCPLLSQRNGYWVCSAGRDAVRPFWGRVFVWGGITATGCYVAATLLALGVLRSAQAAEIEWFDLVWPGNWNRVAQARARSFAFRSAESFVRNRPREALVALGSARRLDPADYRTRLLAAQLAMFQFNVVFADQEFDRMLKDYPDQAERTALACHDAMLMLFRAEPLARHCLKMIARDPGHTALWVRSLLHALRLGPFAEKFAFREAARIAVLPAHARLLIEAEVFAQQGDIGAAIALLSRPFDGPLNPLYMEEQVGCLARLGSNEAASMLLYHYASALGEFEALLTRLDLDFLAQDDASARLDFHRILELMSSPVKAERIMVLLVEHPGADYFRQLHEALRRRPDLAQEVSGAAMWVAGLVCESLDLAQEWKISGRQQFGDSYPLINEVNFDSRRIDLPSSVPALINAVSLPRQVVLALQLRMQPPAAARPGIVPVNFPPAVPPGTP